jgi:type IV fimbrial biogenesis protein FimT
MRNRRPSAIAARPSIAVPFALSEGRQVETIRAMAHIRPAPADGPSAGFTLIELLSVLAILGILIVAAAPSFREAVTARRLESGTTQIVNAVRLARAEAIKRAGLVAVRPLIGTDWTSGLRVHFEADADPSNTRAPLVDTEVRQFRMPSLSTFPPNSPSALAFDAQGRNVALVLNGAPKDSELNMQVNGRSRAVKILSTGSTTIGPIN